MPVTRKLKPSVRIKPLRQTACPSAPLPEPPARTFAEIRLAKASAAVTEAIAKRNALIRTMHSGGAPLRAISAAASLNHETVRTIVRNGGAS